MIFIILCKAVRQKQLAKPKTFLAMRLTAMLLLAGCLQVSASGNAQKVSIHRENASLKKVFTDIKKQTGYLFFYNARLLNDAAPVTLSVKDAEMKEVLELCLRDQPLTFKIVNRTIVISAKRMETSVQAPVADTIPSLITVTGVILDDSTYRRRQCDHPGNQEWCCFQQQRRFYHCRKKRIHPHHQLCRL
jgi:hypothetical protein